MRPPISFNTSFLLSTWVSFACHAAVIAAGFWLHTEPAPRTPPKPVFDQGENAVTIVWRSPVPKEPTPDVEMPEPEPEPEPESEPEQQTKPESEPEEIETPPDPPESPRETPPVKPVAIPLTPRLVQQSRATSGNIAVSSSTETRVRPVSTLLSAPAAPLPSLVELVKEEPPFDGKPGVREEARLSSQLAPRYPRSCRRRGHQGTVRLECRLNSAGSVISAKVVKSSGCDKLDLAALDAIRSARFTPQRVDGEAMAGTIVLPVEFRLR